MAAKSTKSSTSILFKKRFKRKILPLKDQRCTKRSIVVKVDNIS